MARAKDLIRVIAINDAVYPCWFADVGYACDKAWWDHHDGVPGFEGRRVTLRHQKNQVYEGADWLNSTGTDGFEPDPCGLRTAGNSGYQALNLCAHLGAATVLLVGYDMHGTHWFGDHPESCRRAQPNQKRLASHFADLVAPLAERGIRVVNCSPGSAITAFPMGDIETELQRLEAAVAKKNKEPKPVKDVKDAKDTKAKMAVYPNRQIVAGQYKTR
ncbi:MAG: hypothetical protein ACYCZ0_00190 [Minisyncoccota bacterium]